jgi:peptide chain release factor 3
MQSSKLDEQLGKENAAKLREDVELIRNVFPPFTREEYLKGNIAPVFFGSALNNFGVKELLENFLEMAPPPQKSTTLEREVDPSETKFSGFVFKNSCQFTPTIQSKNSFY